MTGIVERQVGALIRLVLVALFAVSLTLIATPTVAAEDFGSREAGRHIYDHAGVLSAAEVSDLEARATANERAGAPTIVYLRVAKADTNATSKDAQELMDAWNVQSGPDEKDGVVIFLNLKPGDTAHGQAAIWVGKGQSGDGGNLPKYELERIYDDVMRPLLSEGQTAAGIGAGLSAMTQDLSVGPPPPPPPSAAQRISSTVAGLPLNIVGILGALLLGLFGFRHWRGRPTPVAQGIATLARPSDLPPALAGALVTRQLTVAPLAEATVLDLARRGMVTLQPEGKRDLSLRLNTTDTPRTAFERAIWDGLRTQTDNGGVVSAKAFKNLAQKWPGFEQTLRAELHQRGWFDPQARAHRVPLYLGGTIALVAMGLAMLPVVIGQQPWGILPIALLGIVGIVLLSFGATYPSTTAEGERVGAPWRAYAAGIKAAARDSMQPLDLEQILTDAAAFGVASTLDRRIKEASAQGFAPAWFARQNASDSTPFAFYPYWIVFHSGSGSSSGGSAGGSVSSGGAGAGGSF
jgi:uncharacterized membrane protein YgcG